MNTKRKLTIARYLGIGAAVLVPALVVAQQQGALPGPFTPNTLLTAGNVEAMRLALRDAIARINTLENQAGAPGASFGKDRVYTGIGNSALISANQRANAKASCADNDDIAMSCTCGGSQAGSGTALMDTRSFQVDNPVGTASSCTCNAEWLGTGMATVTAQVNCLRAP